MSVLCFVNSLPLLNGETPSAEKDLKEFDISTLKLFLHKCSILNPPSAEAVTAFTKGKLKNARRRIFFSPGGREIIVIRWFENHLDVGVIWAYI